MIVLVHLTVGRKYDCRRATLVLGGMLSSGRIHEIVIVIPDHRHSSSSTKEERSIDRSQTCENFENIFFCIICDPSPPSRIASPLFRCFFLFIRFSTISNNTSNNNDGDEHCERTKECSVSEKKIKF